MTFDSIVKKVKDNPYLAVPMGGALLVGGTLIYLSEEGRPLYGLKTTINKFVKPFINENDVKNE